ncbi:MAG: AroM family protein [Sulfolobales archaeon]
MVKSTRRVGLVTIGQSPRVDVVTEVVRVLGDVSVEIVECGALDGLSREEIAALAPREGEYLLVTRLRDGTEVKVSRERIIERMQSCIDKLEQQVDVIGLLCTGEFPELKSRKVLIEPSDLLLKVVESLKVSKLGVVIPSPAQVELTRRKWSSVTPEVMVASASPYTSTVEDIVRTSERLGECDLVVLDCIGFTTEVKKAVARATGKPVILPRTLLARVMRELLEA